MGNNSITSSVSPVWVHWEYMGSSLLPGPVEKIFVIPVPVGVNLITLVPLSYPLRPWALLDSFDQSRT